MDTLLRLLDEGGHPTACFVAHSLGSTAVSWMLHNTIGKTKVHSTVLLDPVTFLLCDPTVATTFVYREPNTTIDFLMHFFLSRELFISNALSRFVSPTLRHSPSLTLTLSYLPISLHKTLQLVTQYNVCRGLDGVRNLIVTNYSHICRKSAPHHHPLLPRQHRANWPSQSLPRIEAKGGSRLL